ncbi:MAG: molybdate ABC transporter substrate-binding protein [Sulfurospirillaceae bacterium]|nr:molybdate ABC transporter substrate-binding protein [Sulfurospirillaceae bacterium]
MLRKVLVALFLSVGLMAGEVSLAVAANMTDAIEVLKKAFMQTHPDIKVSSVLGSSGKLSAQIIAGAPYDIFLSANMKFPQNLYADGVAVSKPIVYASGALAMMSTKGFDLNRGISVINDAKVEKISLANPKTAPYGTATVEAFKSAGLYEKVESKLVYAESISQAVQFATTAADIGFVNMSAFYSPKMKAYVKGKDWVAVDTKLYTPIAQGMVILKKGENNADAKAFYDFLSSAEAKSIFRDFGYVVNE